MSLKILYEAITGELGKALEDMQQPMAEAMTAAMQDTALSVKTKARGRIGAAGFSKRWQNALRVNLYPKNKVSLGPAVWIYHNIIYAGIFEEGGTITGSPLLWLPFPEFPRKIGSHRLTPKVFQEFVAPLHTMRTHKRVPLLGAYVSGRASTKVTFARLRRSVGRHGTHSVPIFFGIPRTRIQAKFGLAAVFQQESDAIGDRYLNHLDA